MTRGRRGRRLARVAPILLPALLAAPTGCAPSRSAMFAPVSGEVERRVGVAPTWRESATDARVPEAVRALLGRPLDRDAAIRIAIATSRRLQASYEDLGLAAADVADATVLHPLEVELEHKVALSGPGSETEVSATQDILTLLQLPRRRAIAGASVRAARARAVAATVELVARVEAAFYAVVAAEQERELRATAFQAARAAADLSERMHRSGGTTDLALVRDRDQREQARIDLARAEAGLTGRREELNQLLGLHGADTRWTVAGRLPAPPAEAPALDDIERDAVAASLERAALRADAEAAAGRVADARLRTLLPELGAGVAASRDEDGEWQAGPAVRIGIPLFDWQSGPRARANAQLRRAQDLLAATAVELRAAARAARHRAIAAHAEARQLGEVVLPLRQRLLEETLLQYNAMNASPFELLQARRAQVDAGRQYIDALRRYWVSTSEVAALRRGVMLRTGSDEPVSGAPAPTPDAH